VSPRHASRTQDCGEDDARRRLRDARAQLDLAELASADSNAEEKKAAASCAVLAGIAAADAACCKSLGRRSRSQDHRDAVGLGRQVARGGSDAAKQLDRLLGPQGPGAVRLRGHRRPATRGRATSRASTRDIR